MKEWVEEQNSREQKHKIENLTRKSEKILRQKKETARKIYIWGKQQWQDRRFLQPIKKWGGINIVSKCILLETLWNLDFKRAGCEKLIFWD